MAIEINGRKIGRGEPPYIVAEISGNHGGDLHKALDLIRTAKWARANAVKFQCYEPDTITIDCDNEHFILKEGPWAGRKLHELYSKAYTPFSWFPTLFAEAKAQNITAFASVFDLSSLRLLEELECPAYKIASMEIVDIPLIQQVSGTDKPIIFSTGMATDEEIREAWIAAGERAIPLACVSGYPTPVSEFNLNTLKKLLPGGDAGVSDHTLGSTIPIAATALGACLIEKHLKLYGDDQIEDADFSMGANEFLDMTIQVRATWEAMQQKPIGQQSRELRRSLYVVQDMKAGDVFTEYNLRSIRPFGGLPPREYPNILGSIAKIDIQRGTPLSAAMVEK